MCLLQIYGVLSSANIPHTQVQGLEECFKHYEHPFVGLETNYQQIQYYKNNFDLIVSSYVSVPAYNNCGTFLGANQNCTWCPTCLERNWC